MGRLALALLALLKPVAEVSTSDIIPGSSSYTLEGGGWYSEWLRWFGKWLCKREHYIAYTIYINSTFLYNYIKDHVFITSRKFRELFVSIPTPMATVVTL